MEFEMVDERRDENDEDDSHIVRDHRALKNQSSVNPEDYPNAKDRALHIPEEEKD